MNIGFAKHDITPRVGVELCGFGPFLGRHSVRVHDSLWARAMALEVDGVRTIVIACDLIGVSAEFTDRVCELLFASTGIASEQVMICSSHTHSGPCTGSYIGWGEPDAPYLETLPKRIAQAAVDALASLQPATLSHAEVPCEGIGLNREYETFWAPYDEAMMPDWRPAKPELTDTTCHVVVGKAEDGTLLGFMTYFGCHPVVCCNQSLVIHGDYPGVALNDVERDHPGSVGLFLQGAQGDVNSAIGGRSQEESLLALEELAGRFASSVRAGIMQAKPIEVDRIASHELAIPFSCKAWGLDELRTRLADVEKALAGVDLDGDDGPESQAVRMNTVCAIALRRLLRRAEAGESLTPVITLHGLRIGPIALLGSPFETFQAIKNDVIAQSSAPIPLVMGLVDDSRGYAPDRTAAARGGYAADTVPLICAELPFTNIHEELVAGLVRLDTALANLNG